MLMSISLPYLFGRANFWWEYELWNLHMHFCPTSLLHFPQHPILRTYSYVIFYWRVSCFFPFFFFFPPVSWQCVITTNSCSSAEAFTPTFYVHTILYQTETPTSEEVGITVGFRRRDSSSGGIFVPSEDNHKPTAGTARAGVEGMTIICIKHIHLSNQFRFLKFLLCVFVTYTPKISGNCLYHLHKVYLC